MTHRRNRYAPATSLAGPSSEERSSFIPPKDKIEPPMSDSSRFLLHKRLYNEAGPVWTCLSFQRMIALPEPNECQHEASFRVAYARHIRAVIIKVARVTPGVITTGASRFPEDKEGAMGYFLAAGFSVADCEFLTEGMES